MCNLVLKIKIQLLKHAIKPSRDFNLNYPKPIHGFLIIRSPLSHRHQTIPKLGVYTSVFEEYGRTRVSLEDRTANTKRKSTLC